MSTAVLSGTYQNGDTTYNIPDEFDPASIWLLVNGQVWTGAALQVSNGVLTVPGVDMTDELVQVSDQSAANTSNLSSALTSIEKKLDAALGSAASGSLPSLTPAARETSTFGGVVSTQLPLVSRKQQYGMDKVTGCVLSGIDHLQQSITDILLTPVGSRVMRRTYGSRLLELIDQPYTDSTVLRVYVAVADALRDWEPRFSLNKIQAYWTDQNQQVNDRKNGTLKLVLKGDYLGRGVSLEVSV